MATDVSRPSLNTYTREQLMAGLSKTTELSQQNNHKYLQFSGREGRYSVSTGAGSEPADFPKDSLLLWNLLETKQGWVCWKDKVVADSDDDYTLFEDVPQEDSLPYHGPYENNRDGWVRQYKLFFKDLNTGEQYVLKLTSKSAVIQVQELIKDAFEQGTTHDVSELTPVVKMGIASFTAKDFKNYKPVFEIVDWKPIPGKVAAKEPSAAITDKTKTKSDDSDMPSSRAK